MIDTLTNAIADHIRAVENLLQRASESSECQGLGTVHVRDIVKGLIESDAGLPAALMDTPADQQKVRVAAALQSLRRDDPDAFDGAFTPFYFRVLREALEAPHPLPTHDLFAMDQMDSDVRRRAIKIVRAQLRTAGKAVPSYDPSSYALAATSARRAHEIELARTLAAKPYAARPADVGKIAGRPEQPSDSSPQPAVDADDRDALRPAHMRLSPMKIRRK